MKELDQMTVNAVGQLIGRRYGIRAGFPLFSHVRAEVAEFFHRADVAIPQRLAGELDKGFDVVTDILRCVDGTPGFERVLLRLASPIEEDHARTLHEINKILWPEGLAIILDGPNPVIRDLETGEQEGMQVVRDNPASPEPVQPVTNASNEIFVVHGRDLGAKDTVARFLEQVKIKPVVLQELPDLGKTVIEKFEYYAGPSGFAIVLLTPDDTGALKGEGNSTKSRARQNVIFELGYFVGKLGRNRVRVLTKGEEVEILSDYSGVIGIPMDDNDGWKLRLVQELHSAGYAVDANDAI